MKRIVIFVLITIALCSCSSKNKFVTNKDVDEITNTPFIKPTSTSDISDKNTPTIENFPEFTLGKLKETTSKEDCIHYFFESITDLIALEEYSVKIIEMGYDVIGAWNYVRFLDISDSSINIQEKHFHAKNSENNFIDIIVKNSNCEIVVGKITDTTKNEIACKVFEKLEDFLRFDNGILLSEDLHDLPMYTFGDVSDEQVKDYVTKLNDLGLYQMEYKDKFDSRIDLSYEYDLCNKTGCIITVQYQKEKSIMNIIIRNNAAMILQNWAEDFN
ncbi:hypothetical protein [Lachnoclostridium phytofermentans]|uniref:Lipoprotein n=1 Tax=Lachnoclostridium phytofermentans (strain ATCC 700394 / DSM 18823 / ISDg) TaxID=357809 RepID=A9KPR3_LACP7|nr:hypothetical protein [Lachnoclostridium phytofermentans]ABX41812.1 hypothetical protein Cphy_1437 [Lachnoclostridium phytofermentans ISDg]